MPINPNDPRFKKGGRKGYELEQKQLDLMRKIVSRDLKLVDKFYEGKAEEADFKMLQALQVRVSKYLDKLHASKSQMDLDTPLLNEEIRKSTEKVNELIKSFKNDRRPEKTLPSSS